MKTKLTGLILALIFAAGQISAQNVVRVKTTSYDISDNLDLEAVASLFGESDDLKEFEEELNDQKNGISNLDLNEDGYIDYLRVVEMADNGNHLICIQAVVGKDLFQDVATIEVERDNQDQYSVVVIGNHFIYGPDYYIRPVYYRRPPIFGFLYGPLYRPWYSPYYWDYYPYWYRHRRPHPTFRYHRHVYAHINQHNRYERPPMHDRHHHNDLHMKIGRNDFGSKYPDRSFEKRQSNYKNRHEMEQNRRSERPNAPAYRNEEKSYQKKEPQYRRSDSRDDREMDRPKQMKNADQTKRDQPDRRERTSTRNVQSKSGEANRPEHKQVDKPRQERARNTPDVRKSSSENKERPVQSKVQRNETRSKSTEAKVEKKASKQSSKSSGAKTPEKSRRSTNEKKTENERR